MLPMDLILVEIYLLCFSEGTIVLIDFNVKSKLYMHVSICGCMCVIFCELILVVSCMAVCYSVIHILDFFQSCTEWKITSEHCYTYLSLYNNYFWFWGCLGLKLYYIIFVFGKCLYV